MKKSTVVLCLATIICSLFIVELLNNKNVDYILETNIDALLATETPEEECISSGGIFNAALEPVDEFYDIGICSISGQLSFTWGTVYGDFQPGKSYLLFVEENRCVPRTGECCHFIPFQFFVENEW
jgi:hypothetical protein